MVLRKDISDTQSRRAIMIRLVAFIPRGENEGAPSSTDPESKNAKGPRRQQHPMSQAIEAGENFADHRQDERHGQAQSHADPAA